MKRLPFPPDGLAEIPESSPNALTPTEAQVWCDSMGGTVIVASDFDTYTKKYRSVMLYKTNTSAEELYSRTSSSSASSYPVSYSTRRQFGTDTSVDIYFPRKTDAMDATGVTVYPCIQDAARQLLTQQTAHTHYGRYGSVAAAMPPTETIMCPEGHPCPTSGTRTCFLDGDDLDTAKHMVRSLPYSQLMSNSDGNGTTDVYNGDSTLFYVERNGNVYIRQNQLRCAPVNVAEQYALQPNVGGIPKNRNNTEDDPSSHNNNSYRCSYEGAATTNSLFPSYCNTGTTRSGKSNENYIFRADLQMSVPHTARCEFPNSATIVPSAPFHDAFRRECPQQAVDQAKVCASTYKSHELTKPYYQYVFPFTRIKMVQRLKLLSGWVPTKNIILVLDKTATYVAKPAEWDYERSVHGQVIDIDISDPNNVRMKYYDQTAHNNVETVVASLVFFTCIDETHSTSDMLHGTIELRDTTNKIEQFQFVVLPKEQIFVNDSSTKEIQSFWP